jgi:predicted ferric reductase
MKALGDFTTSLKRLEPGTIAEIEGAFGRFLPARFDDSPQIWIAGGIGITPFLSIARSFDNNKPQVDMFYSVQTKAELIDQQALEELLPKHFPQFKYHTFINDEQQGFLSATYINEKAGGVAGKEIFLCGPPPMMKALRAQLKEMGVPNSKIHSEEFSMS